MTADHPNGVATKGEHNPAALSQTLQQLPKKSAQESLGLPEGNGLMMPFTVATLATLFLLLLLTLVPYLLNKSNPPAEKPAPPANTDKDAPTPSQPASTPASPSPTPDASSKINPRPEGKGDILNKLKETGTKTEKPSVNPLDKKDDDLLKDIK